MSEIVIKLPKMKSEVEKDIVKGIEVFAKAEVARAVMLERMDKLMAGSKMTDEDALRLGRLVKKGRFKRLRRMGLV